VQPFSKKTYIQTVDMDNCLQSGRLILFIRDNSLLYLIRNQQDELLGCSQVYNTQQLTLSLFLRFVFEKEPYLRKFGNRCEIVSSSDKFSLIPQQFIRSREAYHYANVLLEDSLYEDEVFSCQFHKAAIEVLFISPPHLHHILAEYMPDYQLSHIAAYCFSLGAHLAKVESTHILIHFLGSISLITAFKEGKFIMCNAFEHKTDTGMLYFIQSIRKLLEVDEYIPIYVVGDTDTSASWYQHMLSVLPHAHIPSVQHFPISQELGSLPYWEFAYLLDL